MRKTSVAIILHGLSRNGIDMLMASLAKYWDYSRFDVTYLLGVDPGAPQPAEDEVTAAGARVIHLHDLDRGRWCLWPVTLRRALKKYGPFDAAHYHMYFLNGINARAAKKAGIPVRISHAHNTSHPNEGKIARKIYKSVMRPMMIRHSTKLVSCSAMASRYFYGDQASYVLLNGIDLEKFAPEKTNRERGMRFITVGRLHEQKNPLFLLEVFSEVIRLIPDATLDWVGEGLLEDEVRAKIRELKLEDAVRLLGPRDDVDRLLKQHDYFLFPSRYEGIGNALIEAQAAGLDCFISDPIPEEADCGKCRRIPLSKSAGEWAAEIAEYIRSGETMRIDPEKIGRYNVVHTARILMDLYAGRDIE